MEDYTIGQRIKGIRKSDKIKQKDIAEAIGIKATYLSLIESGKINPSFELISNVAAAMGYELIFRKDIETHNPQ